MIFSFVTTASWPRSAIDSDTVVLLTSLLIVVTLFLQVMNVFDPWREDQVGVEVICEDVDEECQERESTGMDREINAAFEKSASEGFSFVMDLIETEAEVQAGQVSLVLFWCAKTREVVPPQILRCLANYVSRVEPEGRLEIADRLGALREEAQTRELAIVCTGLERMIQKVGEPLDATVLCNAMYGLAPRGLSRGCAVPRALSFLQKQDSIRQRTSIKSEGSSVF